MILRHEDRDGDKDYYRGLIPRAQAMAASISPRGCVVVDDHADRWPCEGGAWVAARVWLADGPGEAPWVHEPSEGERAATAELARVVAAPALLRGCGEVQERGGRANTCTLHDVRSDGTAWHVDEKTSASWRIL